MTTISLFSNFLFGTLAIPATTFGIFSAPIKISAPPSKVTFLESLENLEQLNVATKERTQMVRDLTSDNPTNRPGSTLGFQPFAAGTWSVIYAPHISTMSKLVGEGFKPVIYDLEADGTIVSHARFDVKLPLLPQRWTGWLSVSGTYGTEDNERVCRVDFDKAWIKWNSEEGEDAPYNSLEEVPESVEKSVVQTLGKWAFIEDFSVFPVSYLDDDLIVFDFDLLGTRICARKIKKKGQR